MEQLTTTKGGARIVVLPHRWLGTTQQQLLFFDHVIANLVSLRDGETKPPYIAISSNHSSLPFSESSNSTEAAESSSSSSSDPFVLLQPGEYKVNNRATMTRNLESIQVLRSVIGRVYTVASSQAPVVRLTNEVMVDFASSAVSKIQCAVCRDTASSCAACKSTLKPWSLITSKARRRVPFYMRARFNSKKKRSPLLQNDNGDWFLK